MCTMSTLVFEWTRTVISQRYLDSICLESNIDKHDVIKDMALTAKVKVEWDSNGQIFLEGDWKQLMAIHVSLVKWKQDEEANRTPPSQSLESVAVVEPPIPKTNTQNVLRYIKQKYLNASRRRSSLLSSKKVVPEMEKETATSELVQENEVYVNITVSDGDLSKISSLFGSGQELPYQVSLSTSDLLVPNKESLSTDSIKQETCSELSINSNNENKNFIEKTLGVNNWEEGDLPNVKPEKPSYPLSDCESLEKSVASISEPVTKTFAKKKDYEKLAPFKFFCKSCSFKSKRESHYQRHLELHKKVSELFCCSKCDFTTIRLGHLRRHELTHSDTKLKCDMCHYHTDHLKFLLRHQRIKHCNIKTTAPKQLLRCSNCDYSTTRPYLYQRHLQAHTSSNISVLKDEQRFHCQQCSYKTGRKEHFIRHVNNVHNNKRPYLCDHCGKAFKRPDALKQHRVTHVEMDPSLEVFRCPVCGKCCRAQAQLTQHLAVHSNVRAFLCEICGSSFKTRAVQRKHVLTIHKNPKAFSCLQCSRKFNTKYALRRHMKQHSLDKKRKLGTGTDEPVAETNKQVVAAVEPGRTLRVLMSEPILIQETAPPQVQDPQKAITVQVIGFMQ